MIGSRGRPTIITVSRSGGSEKGIKCCWFQCCTCINLAFFRTETSMLKIAQTVLGLFCQSLAINYGLNYASTMGPAYFGFLTTASWSLMTTFLLLVCYVFSDKSVSFVKQSLFETVFNTTACFSYLSSSSYLAFAVNVFLYPLYLITPYFQVYPAMTAAYALGTIVGLLYGYDAYRSYRYFKGYR